MTIKEFAFDCTFIGAIRITAESEHAARLTMNDTLDACAANLGAWPSGDPILCEVSLDSENPPTLYEVNGENLDDVQNALTVQLRHAVALRRQLNDMQGRIAATLAGKSLDAISAAQWAIIDENVSMFNDGADNPHDVGDDCAEMLRQEWKGI